MSVRVTHEDAIDKSSYTTEQWNEFGRADETKEFRQLRLKHDLHVAAVMKKFADVDSGETALTLALIDELRDGLLRLYQLVAVFERASIPVGDKWLSMAAEYVTSVNLRVGDAQATLGRILAWVKRIDGNSGKQ